MVEFFYAPFRWCLFFFFFCPVRVLEGQVGAVWELSSCKDMKVLGTVRIV